MLLTDVGDGLSHELECTPMKMERLATQSATSLGTLSLKDELELYGIQSMDTEAVDDHMKEQLIDSRVGAFTVIGPILALMTKTAMFVVRHPLLTSLLSCTFALVGLAILLAGQLVGVPPMVGMIMLASLGSAIVLVLAHMITLGIIMSTSIDGNIWDYFLASEIWERTPVDSASIAEVHVTALSNVFKIPEGLHARAKRALMIPGTMLHVHTYGIDPFLSVSRKDGLVTKTYYIGAWNMGVEAFDSF